MVSCHLDDVPEEVVECGAGDLHLGGGEGHPHPGGEGGA